ncbi:MAG: hypothetical protein IJ560_00155 [Alphaproteobacteria bacterium]|nr:hypothetical protein [Alphaproteobacteria bacterium]
MKRIFIIFVMILCCTPDARAAYTYVSGDIDGTSYQIAHNTIFDSTANVSASRIDVDVMSVDVENHGIISGDIYIDNGLMMRIKNTGTMSGTIHVGETNSHVEQIINTVSDITHLSVVGGRTIVIEDANMLSLGLISAIANSDDKINVINSTLLLDCNLDLLPDITAEYNTMYLFAADENGMYTQNVPFNISGAGRVIILSQNNTDPINSTQTTTSDNGALFVRQVRETDYTKILDANLGQFLNTIRTKNPDDKLLRALDAADSIDEISHIMTRSARINPELMMRPIETFNYMIISDIASRADMPDGALRTMYVFSDDFDIYAANINIGTHVTDSVYAAGFASVGKMNWSDDINDFDALMLTIGMRANYNINYTDIIHGVFGITYADFRSDDVFDGTTPISAPNGNSIFGALDFEHRFYFADRFFIAPMIGAMSTRSEIMNNTDFDSVLRGGINVGYGCSGFGMAYGYGMRIYIETPGTIGAEAKVSIWSPLDAAGGDLSFMILDSDEYTSYKLSIGAHFMF